MTDYKQLCAELIEAVLSDDSQVDCKEIARRARTALVSPEPEGPTLDDIDDLCAKHSFFCCGEEDLALLQMVIHSALACWGRPTPQPISVIERLPGPEDCDAEGQVWQWDGPSDAWVLLTSNGISIRHVQGVVDYWLPAHALPLPADD